MLKIYGYQTLNTTKVLLTAEELNLNFDYVHVDLAQQENKTPEHLARHPLGKTPVIEHDGRLLFESNTICRYLAAMETSTLYAGNYLQKAQINQWVDFVTQHAGKWISTFYFEECIRPNFMRQAANKAAIEEAQGFLNEQLPMLEKQFTDHRYLAGEAMSIADIIAFSYINTHEVTSLNLDNYPNMMKWYQGLKQRASFKNALAHYPQG